MNIDTVDLATLSNLNKLSGSENVNTIANCALLDNELTNECTSTKIRDIFTIHKQTTKMNRKMKIIIIH